MGVGFLKACLCLIMSNLFVLTLASSTQLESDIQRNRSAKVKLTVAMSVCEDRLTQGLALIKSMVVFSHNALLDLRIFFDNHTYPGLAQELPIIKDEAREFWDVSVDYELYPVRSFIGDNPNWFNQSQPCSANKLFFHNALPDLDALLYLDSDVIFLSDVTEIWSYFQRMTELNIMAMVSQENLLDSHQQRRRFGGQIAFSGLQSGVILMNLTRLRELEFSRDLERVSTGHSLSNPSEEQLFNTYFTSYPARIFLLPCPFNFFYAHCQNSVAGSSCKEAESRGISLLHGAGREFRDGWIHSRRSDFFFLRLFYLFDQMSLEADRMEYVREKIYFLRKNIDRSQRCFYLTKSAFSRVDAYIRRYGLIPKHKMVTGRSQDD